MKEYRPFYLFTFALLTGLVLPSLIQDGMFMDGMIYASVANNFAQGLGTWWNLHLSETLHASYHQQPPLTLWMESFFFTLLGSGIYTERVYSFVTAVVNGFLIVCVWRAAFDRNHALRKLAWLPVMLWIAVPVCFWSFAHNMQENTMSMFILLSVWSLIRFYDRQRHFFLALAGFCIFLSSMCKGVQGTFTLAVPAIWWLVFRRPGPAKTAVHTAVLAGIPLLIYLVLFQNEVIAQSFHDYFNERLVNTFANPDAGTSGRFYLVYKLALELLIPAIVCLALFLVFRKHNGIDKPAARMSLVFLLIGLCGALPLLVTREQRGFYLVVTLPFFAMALAAISGGGLAAWLTPARMTKYRRHANAVALSALLLAAAATVSQAGKTRRDANMIHDVHLMAGLIGRDGMAGINEAAWREWSLHMYFTRHYHISLDRDFNRRHAYYIDLRGTPPPEGYTPHPVNGKLRQYWLYYKTE